MGGRSVFFNDTATTEIYTLSLHDALPIYVEVDGEEGKLTFTVKKKAAARKKKAQAADTASKPEAKA